MATVKLLNNILENKLKTFTVKPGTSIKEIIEEYSDDNVYDGELVECYDIETGKTFYAPVEDNKDCLNAIIEVNGKSADLDYKVEETDIVGIVITPCGDNLSWDWGWNWWGAIGGALVGALVGFAHGGVIGLFIGAAVGFVAGGIVTGSLKINTPSVKDGTSSKGIDSNQLPDVRGSANQPLTDNCFPLVIGKHLTTPFILGSTWNEISGTHGEINYIHALYAVGYAPLRISDLKLGEIFVSHNQKWKQSPAMKNIFHGELSGIDEGSWEDIKPVYQNNTTIDLANRPQINAQTMRAAGWTDVEEGEIATVYSTAYSNEPTNDKCVLVTPILDDGTVLSPSDLETYANKLLNDEEIPVNILLATFTGPNCIANAEVYAVGLHENQEAFYFNSYTGDIVNTWRDNDIHIEILQQGQNGENIDYGKIYPYAKIQQDVNANCLFIYDESVGAGGSVSYKGVSLKNGLRNNPIRFSEQFPKDIKVELNFSQGLYKTRSNNNDGNSTVAYEQIPMWLAIQWRVFSEENVSYDGEKPGDEALPTWDSEHETYREIDPETQKYKPVTRGWNNFKTINGIGLSTYTPAARSADCEAHSGQKINFDTVRTITETITHVQEIRFYCPADVSIYDVFDYYPYFEHYAGENFHIVNDPSRYRIGTISKAIPYIYVNIYYDEIITRQEGSYTANINSHWLNKRLFNLQSLGGTSSNHKGIDEFRCTTEVNLYDWARENLMAPGDSEETLMKKFKSYFYDPTNTAKSIEIRVVRVSPCYIDETVSTKDHSAYKFNDVFTWKTLTSTMYDGTKLINNNQLVQKRPIDEDRMRKLCVIALKAKTDNTDQLTNTLKKFTCIAESFSPYYDDTEKKWVPENVLKEDKYVSEDGTEITKEDFEQERQEGKKAQHYRNGNDFTKNMVNNVIRTNNHIDEKGRYYIPNDNTLKYCNNNVASMFILAGIGAHLGKDALGYTQSEFDEHGLGDFNMPAFSKWYKWAEDVTDGSTYGSEGYHTDHNGNFIPHLPTDLVHIYFTANAYIYQAQTLETMLAGIAVAGRSIYTKDNKNRFTIVIDKPEKYPVALINQQNTLKSSYTLSFAELPSGLMMNYSDENDGFNTNSIYCMTDGESQDNPKRAIENYSIPFVTNPYQLWSMGRYVLACRILSKEIVVKQIGMEGNSIGLGNLVKVQDNTMLIGTDTGGIITKLIEDSGHIYGFIINNTYKFTGELEEYEDSQQQTQTRCKQGVVVMQPSQYKESKVITLRLAKAGVSRTVDGVQYRMVKGDTNLVLFDTVIAKNSEVIDGSDIYIYKPQVDNIVGFGIIGKETALYRVTKIKADAKHNYELTLIKYQEEIYNYGDVLPSFQNNMTIPDRSEEDAFALSDKVSYKDLVKAINESQNLAKTQIDETFNDNPDTPRNLIADVTKDCIQFRCSMAADKINTVDHIIYEITKVDAQGNETVIELKGSYSTEYYFDRDIDGYPEKEELQNWLFRAKAVSFYLSENGTPIESEWTTHIGLSENSLAEYWTWIPPVPSSINFVASENGIDTQWICNTARVYGKVEFEVRYYYGNELRTQIDKTTLTHSTYQFDRSVDGYPEKPTTPGITLSTLTLDNYTVVVRAINKESNKLSVSEAEICDYSQYKTWIPNKPNVTSRVTGRNVTLTFAESSNCYGSVDYLVGVRRYDDPEEVFYAPDLGSNPYARESAYKLRKNYIYKVGKIESEYIHSQTMPLETQGGVNGLLDTNESKEDDRLLALSEDGTENTKLLSLGLGGNAPIDTKYQFEVLAYNKTVEQFYDNTYHTDHDYNPASYHKVSLEGTRKTVIALATSVLDVLNGSITSDKVADGAIKETKIEDNAISTPKLQANAVVGDKIYAYNMLTLQEGVHSLSGFAWSDSTDENFEEALLELRTLNRGSAAYLTKLDEVDSLIKANSSNYWIGLDTDTPEFYMGNRRVYEKNAADANYFHFYTANKGTANQQTNLDIKLSNFIVTAISSTIKGFFNVRNKDGDVAYFGANSFLQVNPENSTAHEDTTQGYYVAADNKFYANRLKTVEIPESGGVIYEDITNTPHKFYKWNGTLYVETSLETTASESMILKGDLLIQAGNYSKKGDLSVAGTVRLGNTTASSGSQSLNPALVVGNEIGSHLEFDPTSIIAKSSGANVSKLSLNKDGGEVNVGGPLTVGSVSTNRNTTLFGKLDVKDDVTLEGKLNVDDESNFKGQVNVTDNLGTAKISMSASNNGEINAGGKIEGGRLKSQNIEFAGNDGTHTYFNITSITLSGSTLTITTGE